jgi:EAL domain-containing protein (putative c-di-GMP-specific phosphodiesterase class I)
LRDLTLPKRIREAAEAAAFPLTRVVIEITESALVENLEHAQSISMELKAHGCRLALDDFGTGYSSLLHLQSLPFDELKVDRSFVGSMAERRESRKIVSAVVGLGQSLGLETIAEGAETQEQAEMLLLLGCEMGQGWLFGKPHSCATAKRRNHRAGAY